MRYGFAPATNAVFSLDIRPSIKLFFFNQHKNIEYDNIVQLWNNWKGLIITLGKNHVQIFTIKHK